MSEAWRTYLEKHQERFIQELIEFARIPSITNHQLEVRHASEWIANRLRDIGMEHVQIIQTQGNPIVYADWLHSPGKPTVLFYGHVDVQPADPLDLWTSPPFDPEIRDGRLYGRGVGDMKGNVALQLAVLEAFLKSTGQLPLNVKVLYEGEEEIGSPSLPKFVAAHASLLACNFVLDSDSGHSAQAPLLLAGCRGACALEIQVRSADTDIHSGLAGGAVPNALHSLIHILDTMHHSDGDVSVEGFYDDVLPISNELRELLPLSSAWEEELVRQFGIKGFFGEPGYSPSERATLRPTLEVIGMYGGHTGEGLRGVVPSHAVAKIMCRLTANQAPDHILEKIKTHVQRVAPPQVHVTISEFTGSRPAYLASLDDPILQMARQVMTDFYGVPAHFQLEGGTLPVTSIFRQHMGVNTLSIGADSKNEHAPNESFSLDRFSDVQKLWCVLLERAARLQL